MRGGFVACFIVGSTLRVAPTEWEETKQYDQCHPPLLEALKVGKSPAIQ